MKNRIILCLGCLLAFLQLRAQVNTNQQHLCNPNSFSIVLLGDPQNYVKYDYNQPVFELMTAWTAHHIDSLRVKAVLCTGDLVDQNECILPPFPRFGNLTSRGHLCRGLSGGWTTRSLISFLPETMITATPVRRTR